MQKFALEEQQGELTDLFEAADAEVRLYIGHVRNDRSTPNSPTFIPGNSASG